MFYITKRTSRKKKYADDGEADKMKTAKKAINQDKDRKKYPKTKRERLTKGLKTGSKNKKIAYLKNQFSSLISSFKHINLDCVFVILYGIIFYALAFLLANSWAFFLGKLTPGDTVPETMSALYGLAENLDQFMWIIAISGIIIFFIMVVLWAFSRLMIWNHVINQKIDMRGMWKFVLLIVLWGLISLGVLYFPSIWFAEYLPKQGVLSIFFVLLFFFVLLIVMYLTSLLYIFFVQQKKKNIIETIKSTFLFGLKNIKHFIIPWVAISLVFLLIGVISNTLKILPQQATMIITILLLFVYMVWIRYYLFDLFIRIRSDKL